MFDESAEEPKMGSLRHTLRELVRAIGPEAGLRWFFTDGLSRVPVVGPHSKIDRGRPPGRPSRRH